MCQTTAAWSGNSGTEIAMKILIAHSGKRKQLCSLWISEINLIWDHESRQDEPWLGAGRGIIG